VVIDRLQSKDISNEIKEKLARIKAGSSAQANHISGVTPAALIILQIYLKKRKIA